MVKSLLSPGMVKNLYNMLLACWPCYQDCINGSICTIFWFCNGVATAILNIAFRWI